jgi:lipopolysaccharide export system permease protein
MKTIRRLFFGEVITAVSLVTLGFIALFFFFDFVEELQSVGRISATGYKIPQALIYVALMAPSHVYELIPITVLIGTIFVMARLAQSSEFTILRTSGLGPWRALRTLLSLGLVFVVFTFAVGEYVKPDFKAKSPWAKLVPGLKKSKTMGTMRSMWDRWRRTPR